MRLLTLIFGDRPVTPARTTLLRRCLALFALLLVASTWRLWTPQHRFPQVPFFHWAGALPAGLEWALAAAMVTSLIAALAVSRPGRMANAALQGFAVSAAILILADQGRLQPWAYQFILTALVLSLAKPLTAFDLLRLLTVSFYLHSALSKLDYSFVHTLGQQFLAALAGAVGLSVNNWSEAWRVRAAFVFPIGELLVALGLCWGRSRQLALLGAVTLHVLLLAILGPMGLDHRPGVLLWNVYFIVQDVLLFWAPRSHATDESIAPEPSAGSNRGTWAPRAMIYAAALLPFLAPIAWFDLWPSWGLYASSAQRVVLLVHRLEWDRLPGELQSFRDVPSADDEPWVTLHLDRWALESLHAPIYPQSRFQLGVAQAVTERLQLTYRARVIRFDMSDRWTGARRHEIFVSPSQWEAAQNEYFLNARPRPWIPVFD